MKLAAAARLHGAAGGEAGEGVAGSAVGELVAEVIAVGVLAREVEEVDAREDDEEAAEKRNCVYGGCGVEALEEQAGCDERAGCEGYVVEGVDTIFC